MRFTGSGFRLELRGICFKVIFPTLVGPLRANVQAIDQCSSIPPGIQSSKKLICSKPEVTGILTTYARPSARRCQARRASVGSHPVACEALTRQLLR